MVHLGDHPEVRLCLRCAHFVHQQAWQIEDQGGDGPGGRVRDGLRILRAGVLRRGWHRNRFARGGLRWLGRYLALMLQIELLVVRECPIEAVAADLIATAVADTGVAAIVTCTVIGTEEQAQRRGFVGSPTILLNGVDALPVPQASVGVACGLYFTPDGLAGVPRMPDLRQALKRAAA